MRTTTLRTLFLFLILLLPCGLRAQDFDFATVEALIRDHKKMRIELAARSMVEYENQLLHRQAADQTIEHDSIGKKLANYTRCFEVIELIYSSGKIFFNAKNTYTDVIDVYIPKLHELNKTYIERCLARGSIMTSDSIIIKCYESMVNTVIQDGKELISSVYDLAMYTTGVASCTRKDLISIMYRINGALEAIRKEVREAYFVLWKYITIRTTAWKKAIYRAKSMSDIVNESFEIWKENARGKE